MTTVIDIADLPARAGGHLGYRAGRTITSDRVGPLATGTGARHRIDGGPEWAEHRPFGGGASVTPDADFEVTASPKPSSVAQVVSRFDR